METNRPNIIDLRKVTQSSSQSALLDKPLPESSTRRKRDRPDDDFNATKADDSDKESSPKRRKTSDDSDRRASQASEAAPIGEHSTAVSRAKTIANLSPNPPESSMTPISRPQSAFLGTSFVGCRSVDEFEKVCKIGATVSLLFHFETV